MYGTTIVIENNEPSISIIFLLKIDAKKSMINPKIMPKTEKLIKSEIKLKIYKNLAYLLKDLLHLPNKTINGATNVT